MYILSCGAGGSTPCPRSGFLETIVGDIIGGVSFEILVAVLIFTMSNGHIAVGPSPEVLLCVISSTLQTFNYSAGNKQTIIIVT